MDSSLRSCWVLFIVFIINNGTCDILAIKKQEISSMTTNVPQPDSKTSGVESTISPGWWLPPIKPEEEGNGTTEGNETIVPLIILRDPPLDALGNATNITDIEGDIIFEGSLSTDENATDIVFFSDEVMDPEESVVAISDSEADSTSDTNYTPTEAYVTTIPTTAVSTDIDNNSTSNMTGTDVSEAPSIILNS